jgi:hypothetical protein
MSPGILHKWLLWTALAVYACVGLVPVRGLVLCIDAQGHVALEAANAQAACFDCPTVSPADEGCCAEPGAEGATCTCTDVLVHSVKTQSLRSASDVRVPAAPPASIGALLPEILLAAAQRGVLTRHCTALPVLPRVPANLVLRV